ncbi:pentapeptide repeat-containing protein, partial [Acaryochloris marina NIES-2412]|uniref:pentapeptide repeat-containing protein n=1 Tax=Acaryochloris marina TaxID=155978 RepID=UPI00405863A1
MVRALLRFGSENFDLLEILRRGPDAWNQWREKNPNQEINLSGADLSGADLHGADLHNAKLSSAKLNGADLRSADL